jgi:quercetin dioxygenase-like cupin family protein
MKGSLMMLACVLGFVSTTAAFAQTEGIQRTIVQKADLSIPDRETIVVRVQIEPGIVGGKHTHPGDEIAYVLEGEGEMLVEGEPPRALKAGEAFVVLAGKAHSPKNTGTVPLKIIAVYAVEKGKPLASPAK